MVGTGDLFLQIFQTGSGVKPASYSMGTGFLSRGVKRSEREVDHSFPSTAEVNNGSIYTTISHYAFITWTGRILLFTARN